MIDAHYLYDSANWAKPDDIHSLFARMRKDDPVHLCESSVYPNLWHLTKHADIFEIEKRNDVFLNEPRLVIYPRMREDALREQSHDGSLNVIKSLVTYDAPDHPKMRLLSQAWFMPKNLRNLQGRIESSAGKGLETITSANGTFDFAKDVAVEFPLRVVMAVLGIPSEDYSMMLKLTQELFGPDDPETQREGEEDELMTGDAVMETFLEFAAYFAKFEAEKRENPTDDVGSIIANAEIDGIPLDAHGKLGYYIIIATAGHDTTSYSLNQAVYELAKSPELFKKLKRNPEEMAKKITEEAIRHASSVRHFVRTANQDYELRGKTIKKGDSVILWYPSGSRDEDIFENPDVFNPDRDMRTRHAAFGHASHMCLGMHLARQEITTFLKLMAEKVDGLELDGDPKYTQANFVSGIKSLPIRATLKS